MTEPENSAIEHSVAQYQHWRVGEERQAELDLTIVVPCLNEEKNIAGTLDTVTVAMSELPHTYEIIVIDDGSTDHSSDVVKEYCNRHPQAPIRLHQNARNYGLARTCVDGAFLGRGKYYRLVCGDNVEPKDTMVAIFRETGKVDLVVPYHPPVHGKTFFRRLLSEFYTFLVNKISGYNLHYYNGMPVTLRHDVMRWGPYSFGFGFQAELITRLLDEGATFIEIPVIARHEEKVGFNSALNWRNFLSVSHTLLELLLRRVRKRAFNR